jgi:hypothetical protein
MTNNPMADLLIEAGYTDGWAISGETLVLWEHDTDPPAPLTRPTEASNEATTTDADTGTSPE